MKTQKRIAILVTDGFEESELTSPKEAVEQAGAKAFIVSPKAGRIKSWKDGDWGRDFDVDMKLEDANPEDFDALILPGGVINPDTLRQDDRALSFVRSFFQAGKSKPVAAICHGPLTLVSAGVVNGRTLTSYASIKDDLANAGASWVDKEVVCDKGLVTSRKPDDLDAFNKKAVVL